jgi:hypothetical protein
MVGYFADYNQEILALLKDATLNGCAFWLLWPIVKAAKQPQFEYPQE